LAFFLVGSIPTGYLLGKSRGLDIRQHGSGNIGATNVLRTSGRVMGVISLVNRGAHATGLLLISPLFAVFAPRAIFAGAALAIPVVGTIGAALAYLGEKRRRDAGTAEI